MVHELHVIKNEIICNCSAAAKIVYNLKPLIYSLQRLHSAALHSVVLNEPYR
jgi:hypothetical protein